MIYVAVDYFFILSQLTNKNKNVEIIKLKKSFQTYKIMWFLCIRTTLKLYYFLINAATD